MTDIAKTTCPHDCPSACSLDVEVLGASEIGRVHGSKSNTYTDGVICAKVARYAERIHHPDRLTVPLRRTGKKGSGEFEEISWDEALDATAQALLKAEEQYGPETVWPYFYAGTMGQVMRDGINRLRHVKKYSGQHSTLCSMVAGIASRAGTGKTMGPDPREMAVSDLVIIWGTNPVSTQVNVMTHAVKARKNQGAKIVVIDTYNTPTAKQADEFVCVRPGTDGALACALMHVLFRDDLADREFMARYADAPEELEAHLKDKTPEWAAAISGVPAAQIEELAAMIGATKKTYFRLGFGFTRNRNGAVAMHSAFCVATVSGAWAHEGGGAFHSNGDIFELDKTMIEGLDVRDPGVRIIDMSRIGPALNGDPQDLGDGPPITAMLIQNTNPMNVAPDLNKVRQGFAREDLFVCVHEQFMTETAKMADIVLPATMFMEHDDLYRGGGHQHISLGPKIIDAPEGCRTNHFVICELARRLGASHPGFEMTPLQLIDDSLEKSGYPDTDALMENCWIDVQPDFDTSHYRGGFAHADGKFHFKADWAKENRLGFGPKELMETMPTLPDHWAVIEQTSDEMPFKLVTAPARNYLNSTFTETRTSIKKEGEPHLKINPLDADTLTISDGDRVRLGNQRGTIVVKARLEEGAVRGVVVVESVWPNAAFEEGIGVNALTGADPTAPSGGVPFHDNAIWIRKI
ncbi:MAG: molybdopterin-dependent oxidoreductase [Rhodospirillaceae bacterium]|nr:molybdopterin-dependent oxidoreductase [Rhodospirillaceae bacterium]